MYITLQNNSSSLLGYEQNHLICYDLSFYTLINLFNLNSKKSKINTDCLKVYFRHCLNFIVKFYGSEISQASCV